MASAHALQRAGKDDAVLAGWDLSADEDGIAHREEILVATERVAGVRSVGKRHFLQQEGFRGTSGSVRAIVAVAGSFPCSERLVCRVETIDVLSGSQQGREQEVRYRPFSLALLVAVVGCREEPPGFFAKHLDAPAVATKSPFEGSSHFLDKLFVEHLVVKKGLVPIVRHHVDYVSG